MRYQAEDINIDTDAGWVQMTLHPIGAKAHARIHPWNPEQLNVLLTEVASYDWPADLLADQHYQLVLNSKNQLNVMLLPEVPGIHYVLDIQSWQWTADQSAAAAAARQRRQILLAKSDWTDTNSAPVRLGQQRYDAWQTYRQALRDISNQAGFPMQIQWPDLPE